MSMSIDYFKGQVKRIAGIWPNSPVLKNNLNALSNALDTDTTTHSQTIQAPPDALKLGGAKGGRDQVSNKVRALINRGKGGNLANTDMASAINEVVVELALS
jgi:hypothetical protein